MDNNFVTPKEMAYLAKLRAEIEGKPKLDSIIKNYQGVLTNPALEAGLTMDNLIKDIKTFKEMTKQILFYLSRLKEVMIY